MRIIIIGAGIVGAALADRLMRPGAHPRARVTLVEEHQPGTGTTATSLAWLNANDPTNLSYHRFRVQALQAWRRLSAEFDNPPWYRASGNITWATSPAARTQLADRVTRLTAQGYEAEPISTRRLSELEPAIRIPDEAFIAHFPNEAYLHGALAARALTERAHLHGADLVTGHRVTRLLRAGDHVTGIGLDNGQNVHGDVTICAAGWRSPQTLAEAQVTLPLIDAAQPGSPAPCLIATTAPTPEALVNGLIHTPGLYLRPTPDHGLLLEASDIDATIDMTTSPQQLDTLAAQLLDRAHTLLPALDTQIASVQRCVRPLPIDGLPLIGWLRPGLYAAVTHSAMTLAPLLATLISRDIDNGPEPLLEDYRPDANRTSGAVG